jgi:polyhydroxyalkanoate synthesis repressor PhaR
MSDLQTPGKKRVVKRYANRKMYDTHWSRYVTLAQIAEMVRDGEEVQILDNATKEDLTEVTLAQIIFEQQKSNQKQQKSQLPMQTLRELIHQRTETVLTSLREGPIGRLIPGPKESTKDTAPKDTSPKDTAAEAVARDDASKDHEKNVPIESSATSGDSGAWAAIKPKVAQAKETIEDWQQRMDERISALVPWHDLVRKVQALEARVVELEHQLAAQPTRGAQQPTETPADKASSGTR